MSGGITLEVFAGPGGLSEGLRMIGARDSVGIELDRWACATRAAAGHRTIRADVAAFPVDRESPCFGQPAVRLSDRVTGICGSPPCTTFSMAGKRAGTAVTDVLDALIRDLFEGGKTRAAHRREMARLLTRSLWPDPKMTREKRSAAIWKAVRSASLVAEPARFIAACDPEWVALEQVPAVLPLWEVYAGELRKRGYSAWCGLLNSADYGVPQTRIRAILIASRVRQVRRPYPTHYDPRKGAQLFGTPWRSMADALGWGATARPAPTATAGGTSTGGAEPFGHRDRQALEAERDAGRWVLGGPYRTSPGDRTRPRTMDESEGDGEWVLHTNRDQRPDGTRQTADPQAGPAPSVTGKSGGQWVLARQVGKSEAATRRDHPIGEPAPTITGGGSAAGSGNGAGLAWKLRRDRGSSVDRRDHPASEPAPTITSAGAKPGANLTWVHERPPTTVQGDPRIGRPGSKNRDPGGEPQFAVDSVRITPEEAAALQAFRPGYPFQGTRTKVFEQIGNSFPPLMAAHVLAMATGIEWEAAAA